MPHTVLVCLFNSTLNNMLISLVTLRPTPLSTHLSAHMLVPMRAKRYDLILGKQI